MPKIGPGTALRLSTTEARDRLSEIVARVQDPRAFCVLTRHGKPMAALVSMAELRRLHDLQEIEDVVRHGHRPVAFRFGIGLGARTAQEAAQRVLQLQMDRRIEREVLAQAGLDPVPGGELTGEAEGAVEVRKRRWWAVFFGQRAG